MNLSISNTADKPIYQQLFEQVSSQIIKGELAVGACLPPIRTVAKELRISVITVKKAWEELERMGFIHSMVGRGCFVAPLQSRDLDKKRDALVFERLHKDLAYYRTLGLSKPDFIRLVERHYGG